MNIKLPEYDDRIVIEFIQLDGRYLISEQFNAYMKSTPCTTYNIEVKMGIETFNDRGILDNRYTGNSTVIFVFPHQCRPYIEAGIKAVYGIEIRQPKLDNPSND